MGFFVSLSITILFTFLTIGSDVCQAQTQTIVWGRGGDSISLDPALAQDGESLKVTMHIFETLVRFKTGTFEIEPWLAKSWTTSENGTVWTFTLRDGLKFSDGSPCNAEAVAFSYMRQLDKNHPYYTEGIWAQSTFAGVKAVEALDRLTVRITLEKPYAPFLSNLAMIAAAPIVCPNAVKRYGNEFGKNPVGSGPLAFIEWIPGERIVLQRNPHYWGPAPDFETLIFRSIINNRNRLSALKAGVLHGMDGVDYEIQRQVIRDESLQLTTGLPMNVGYLAMNTQRPPFDNVLVRRAVNHAINKQSLVKLFYQDIAVIAKGPLPPGMLGYDPDQPEYGFDPQQARELMRQAGYAEGVTARLWTPPVPRPAIPEPMKIAMSIQSSLAAIGIRLEIVSPATWREYLDQVNNGEHDACLLSWMGDNGDPDNFLYTLLDLDNAVKPRALNRAFFRDQDVHALLIQAQQELDPKVRDALYKKALLRIHDQAPWVPLAHAQTLMAVHSDLLGCEMTAFNLPYLANASRRR